MEELTPKHKGWSSDMLKRIRYLSISLSTIHINRTMIYMVINKYRYQEQQKLKKYRERVKSKEVWQIH